MMCLVQGRNESKEDYKEAFESLGDILEQQGGGLVYHPGIISERALDLASKNGRANGVPIQDDVDRAELEVTAEIKACYMLSGSNDAHYG